MIDVTAQVQMALAEGGFPESAVALRKAELDTDGFSWVLWDTGQMSEVDSPEHRALSQAFRLVRQHLGLAVPDVPTANSQVIA